MERADLYGEPAAGTSSRKKQKLHEWIMAGVAAAITLPSDPTSSTVETQGLGSKMASGWEGGLEGWQFSSSGREESHGFALG